MRNLLSLRQTSFSIILERMGTIEIGLHSGGSLHKHSKTVFCACLREFYELGLHRGCAHSQRVPNSVRKKIL